MWLLAPNGLIYLACGILLVAGLIFAYNFFSSKKSGAPAGSDPWGAPTLEWSIPSPPPDYNFAFTPVVHEIDAWWDMKKHGYQRPLTHFAPIHMPANTGSGAVISALSLVFGFALIWHMWLLAGVSFAALLLASIIHTFNYKRDFYIPASDVIATEEARALQLARHV